uniref:Phosphopantetheine adenylyltransferase n=1 Tax=Caldisericum exile TaxID=693075 RepID=A0A7C4Y5B6_9BACT
MREIIVAYPGTFDPITYGHIEIIERGALIFDEVVVLVAKREEKHTLFSLEERFSMVKKAVEHLKNVKVSMLDKLLVDYLEEHNIKIILRGLRSEKDFEYEREMFEANCALVRTIETVFLISKSKYAFLSSTLIKEIALNGGDISQFVPEVVIEYMDKKIRRGT